MRKYAAVMIAAFLCGGAVSARAAVQGPMVQSPFPRTLSIVLDIRINYGQEKVAGDCRMTVYNPEAGPIRRIPLILYRLMKVLSVKDDKNLDLPFTQAVRSFEDWEKLQANCIDVSLPEPIPSRGRKTITIRYEGYLEGYADAGMRYVKERVDRAFTILRPDCLAYPQVGYPSWKTNRSAGLESYDYIINVAVPSSMTVANGGRLMEIAPSGEDKIYSYKNIKPAWRMDIAIADYRAMKDEKSDFKIFHFPDDAEGARRVLKGLHDSVELCTKWFGPSDLTEAFTIIEVPEGFGSQADVTSILQTRDAFLNTDQMHQIYHEISHLWNVASLDPLPPRFESEGLATFLEYLIQERLENRAGALQKRAQAILERLQKEFSSNQKARDTAMIDYGREGFSDLAYREGMLFFYVLYHLVGEESLFKAVGSFYKKFRISGATARQFLDDVERSVGRDLGAFYQDWVYSSVASKRIAEGASLADLLR